MINFLRMRDQQIELVTATLGAMGPKLAAKPKALPRGMQFIVSQPTVQKTMIMHSICARDQHLTQ